MINFTNAKLSRLIIHFVGNKNNNEEYLLSDDLVRSIPKEREGILTNYFISAFKNSPIFKFWHEADINLNPCFSYASSIFKSEKEFVKNSKNICKHLYECTEHHNIKSGDLFIAQISNCIYNEEIVDILAILKSETKDTFLKPKKDSRHFDLEFLSGININKVDKGCLIINTAKKEGYKVAVIDTVNKGSEAAYWRDDFLKIIDCVDEFYSTNKVLGIAKNYITGQYSADFVVDKTDQIDLLNRSIDYFKSHDAFDQQEFEQEVFHHPQVIQSFRNFDNQFRQEHDLEIEDTFQISNMAVKKQSRVFKSVLKLDRNFHIYIHGNKEMIEKGVEADGRKFYKIYYENED